MVATRKKVVLRSRMAVTTATKRAIKSLATANLQASRATPDPVTTSLLIHPVAVRQSTTATSNPLLAAMEAEAVATSAVQTPMMLLVHSHPSRALLARAHTHKKARTGRTVPTAKRARIVVATAAGANLGASLEASHALAAEEAMMADVVADLRTRTNRVTLTRVEGVVATVVARTRMAAAAARQDTREVEVVTRVGGTIPAAEVTQVAVATRAEEVTRRKVSVMGVAGDVEGTPGKMIVMAAGEAAIREATKVMGAEVQADTLPERRATEEEVEITPAAMKAMASNHMAVDRVTEAMALLAATKVMATSLTAAKATTDAMTMGEKGTGTVATRAMRRS